MNKKITAIALTLALAFSVAGPVLAEDPTIESLLAQIQQLQALITQLQGGGTTTPTTGIPAACTGVSSFNRNLSLGAKGTDVKCLQALLNMDTTTQVAVFGVGSKGQETEYFGGLTRTAVIKFQNKYAAEVLTPIGLTTGTGFVGTLTRTKLNSMLTAPVTPPVIPPVIPPTKEPFGEIECFNSTEETITLSYEVKNVTDASLFRNNIGLEIIGSKDKSGSYIVKNLSPDTEYTFYLRNGSFSTSKELDRIKCKTQKEKEKEKFLKIISPKENSEWIVGKKYNIEWTSNRIDKVDIYLDGSRVNYNKMACSLIPGTKCPPAYCFEEKIAENIDASLGKYEFIPKYDYHDNARLVVRERVNSIYDECEMNQIKINILKAKEVWLSKHLTQCNEKWQEKNMTMEEYFTGIGITIKDSFYIFTTGEVCEACDCLGNAIANILINEKDVDTVKKYGFNVVGQGTVYHCNIDSDCVSVADGCCNCNHGGVATSINKKYLDYWSKKNLDNCGDVACMTVMSNHWTCYAESKCVKGKCQLKESGTTGKVCRKSNFSILVGIDDCNDEFGGDVYFQIKENTVITNDYGEKLSFNDIQVGDIVNVQDTGFWLESYPAQADATKIILRK